jgi:phage N-6-adenine-methyltransferase
MTYKGAPMKSDVQTWGTPQAFFEYVQKLFQIKFTLDACASDFNFKVENYYNEEINALIQNPKDEIIWMNPPFGLGGKLQKQFIEKASEWGENNFVCCLIPARTDTKLFHEIIWPNALSIAFIKGRLNHEGPNREKCNNATFPSMLVLFSSKDKFHDRPIITTLKPTTKERGM